MLLENANDPETGYPGSHIYLYLGKNSIASESVPDFIFTTESDFDRFMPQIASGGDVNNDGYCDLMVARVTFDPMTFDARYSVSLFLGSENITNEPYLNDPVML